MSVSVVIPTIGRESLGRAIESALDQSLPPLEVVIVNDSADQATLSTHWRRLDGMVREIYTGGLTGIGAARNAGVHAADGSYIAYLDDDDIWLPGHLHAALREFRERPDLGVYAALALQAHGDGARVVPRARYDGRSSLLDFFYGLSALWSRQSVVPSTTYVFRKSLGIQIPMDVDLKDRMDVWWLLNVEAAGWRIYQSPSVATVWYEIPDRTAGRWSDAVVQDWARRLETLKAGCGGRYLVHVLGRYLVLKGDRNRWESVVEFLERDHLLSITADVRFAASVQRRALHSRVLRTGLLKMAGRESSSTTARRPTNS